jgi:hypothetical protein
MSLLASSILTRESRLSINIVLAIYYDWLVTLVCQLYEFHFILGARGY